MPGFFPEAGHLSVSGTHIASCFKPPYTLASNFGLKHPSTRASDGSNGFFN